MTKHPLLRYLFTLSLISIILQVISLSTNLVKDPQKTLYEQAEKLQDIKPDMANQLKELAYEYQTNKYFQVIPYINLFFILCSLLAVIGMWQVHKNAWYLYLFAEFSPYVLSIFRWEDYIKYSSAMGGRSIILTFTFILFAFDILFAGLYFYALRETQKMQAPPNSSPASDIPPSSQ